MCMYVYKYVHLCGGYPRRLETGVRDPGAEVTGSYEPPNINAGN